jgi:hypothetical protein
MDQNSYVDVRPLRFVKHADPGHVLVLQTSPRAENYLERTLLSLRDCGVNRWAGPRIVVADGYDPRVQYTSLLDGWVVEPLIGSRQQRHARTMLRGLLRASESPGFTRLTLVEDDVVFAKGALDWMALVDLDPDIFFAAWFTLYPAPHDFSVGAPYWHVRPMNEYSRTQAISLPGDTVRAVLNEPGAMGWPPFRGGDQLFRHFWPTALCAICYPNIVQHIGTASTHTVDQPVQVSTTFVADLGVGLRDSCD